ncbi:MAG: hypothetical protein JXR76_30795 [Deltaproteobacteria bacterium]|nr:hypothetical protein [Deltaproteobacteria bacterium]
MTRRVCYVIGAVAVFGCQSLMPEMVFRKDSDFGTTEPSFTTSVDSDTNSDNEIETGTGTGESKETDTESGRNFDTDIHELATDIGTDEIADTFTDTGTDVTDDP